MSGFRTRRGRADAAPRAGPGSPAISPAISGLGFCSAAASSAAAAETRRAGRRFGGGPGRGLLRRVMSGGAGAPARSPLRAGKPGAGLETELQQLFQSGSGRRNTGAGRQRAITRAPMTSGAPRRRAARTRLRAQQEGSGAGGRPGCDSGAWDRGAGALDEPCRWPPDPRWRELALKRPPGCASAPEVEGSTSAARPWVEGKSDHRSAGRRSRAVGPRCASDYRGLRRG